MYLVIKAETCGRCSGRGYIDNPVWEEFWEAYKDKDYMPEKEEIEDYFIKIHGLNSVPPQIIDCFQCDGDGIVKEEVDLKKVLKELGYERVIKRNRK